MSYECQSCNGAKPPQMLITSLLDGSTDAACADDIPIMLIGQLGLQLEVDPQKLYDVIQKWTAREAAKEAKAAEAAQAQPPDSGGQPDPGPTDDQLQDWAEHNAHTDGLVDADLGREQ